MSVSVAVKASYECGEGPHWEEKSQSLLYVDIIAGEIHRWNSVTGEDSKVTLGRYKLLEVSPMDCKSIP